MHYATRRNYLNLSHNSAIVTDIYGALTVINNIVLGSSSVLSSQLRGKGILEVFSCPCLAPAIVDCLAKDLFIVVVLHFLFLGEEILFADPRWRRWRRDAFL